MPVVDSHMINQPAVCTGWIDEYKTVVKLSVDFKCGCGHPITIKGRKMKSADDKYDFIITHRNKVQKVVSKDPTEVQVFDKMLKVSTYVACRFPLRGARGARGIRR